MRRIVHLVDDTSPGGVTRLLDFIRAAPGMGALGQHEVVVVDGGLSAAPPLTADVVVSHVVLSWRNLPFFARLRARHRATPLIHMEHSYSPAFMADHVAHPTRFRAMLRLSFALFDRVITISTAQRDWLQDVVGLPAPKTAFIPPCVDLSRFLDLPAPSGPVRRVGALGRLDPQKGFDILVQAFRAVDVPGATLEIFGDGPERAHLDTLAQEDPRIVFHGHVADPMAAMKAVDAIAMPSRREPYGLVALEALAAARPLLVSRADGLRDHAANGAIPVATLEVTDWTAALTELMTGETAEASDAARRNAAQAERRFCEGWARLLTEVAG